MTKEQGLPPWPDFGGWGAAAMTARAVAASVGDFVFVKTDRRVYRKNVDGRGVGGPIERYTYQVAKIVGETRVSWLVAESEYAERQYRVKADDYHVSKFQKKPKPQSPVLYGREDVEEKLWVCEHRSRIIELVRFCEDCGTLRAVAAAVNYRPKEP